MVQSWNQNKCLRCGIPRKGGGFGGAYVENKKIKQEIVWPDNAEDKTVTPIEYSMMYGYLEDNYKHNISLETAVIIAKQLLKQHQNGDPFLTKSVMYLIKRLICCEAKKD